MSALWRESLLVLRGAATASEGPVRAVAVRLWLLDRPFHSCRLCASNCSVQRATALDISAVFGPLVRR